MTTTLSTTFLQKSYMTKKTLERRTQQLVDEIMQHLHKEELLQLMEEQLLDDMDAVEL